MFLNIFKAEQLELCMHVNIHKTQTVDLNLAKLGDGLDEIPNVMVRKQRIKQMLANSQASSASLLHINLCSPTIWCTNLSLSWVLYLVSHIFSYVSLLTS